MTVAIRNLQRSVKPDLKLLERDAQHLLDALRLKNAELSILITNDKRTLDLNRQYRGKDRTTDVLSFPMHEPGDTVPDDTDILLGDVVLNAHMAFRLSQEDRVTLHSVLRRLLIHGVLHLAGFDHEGSPSAAKKMRQKEKQLADALTKMDR